MGWIPVLPANRSTSLKEVFGTCADVLERTVDRCGVVAPHPPIEGWVDKGPTASRARAPSRTTRPSARGSGAGVRSRSRSSRSRSAAAPPSRGGRCPALWTPWAKAKGSPGALKRGRLGARLHRLAGHDLDSARRARHALRVNQTRARARAADTGRVSPALPPSPPLLHHRLSACAGPPSRVEELAAEIGECRRPPPPLFPLPPRPPPPPRTGKATPGRLPCDVACVR